MLLLSILGQSFLLQRVSAVLLLPAGEWWERENTTLVLQSPVLLQPKALARLAFPPPFSSSQVVHGFASCAEKES